MKRITLILLVIAAAAVTTAALLVYGGSARSGNELSKARSRWQTAGIAHYRFNLRVACFCAFVDKMPMTIEVRDGQIASIRYSDGTPVSAEDQKMFERYLTIDRLFDFTAQSQKDADQIEVVYDPTYGFPTTVQIDFIKQAADDELGLFVSDFQALK